jgi:hypothetical protein
MVTPSPQKPNAVSATRSIEYLAKQMYIKHIRKYFCTLWNFFRAPESENKYHFVELSLISRD